MFSKLVLNGGFAWQIAHVKFHRGVQGNFDSTAVYLNSKAQVAQSVETKRALATFARLLAEASYR